MTGRDTDTSRRDAYTPTRITDDTQTTPERARRHQGEQQRRHRLPRPHTKLQIRSGLHKNRPRLKREVLELRPGNFKELCANQRLRKTRRPGSEKPGCEPEAYKDANYSQQCERAAPPQAVASLPTHQFKPPTNQAASLITYLIHHAREAALNANELRLNPAFGGRRVNDA